jgi:hypothetical protein
MTTHQIMIIRMNQRVQNAEKLQKTLSAYGCGIRTRLGLHEAGMGDSCANDGLIILQMAPGVVDCDAFASDLNKIDGITSKLVEI